ncbi:hypothetical protein [Tolypothrix sp. PCC 7601]|uniref:hypothetical protein n=1 Tax=Tolypothrix sp. PCC 7601 TaxID=1188 RepID=UPI00143AFD3C|nr:hypothetical protein [Tolypothrix sp. PCC 7601]UYD38818.1 hypothetical protein HG267_40545 [Tolypothrix sp. PCC 7601]
MTQKLAPKIWRTVRNFLAGSSLSQEFKNQPIHGKVWEINDNFWEKFGKIWEA